MSQSRKRSLLESIINIIIGYSINLVAQLVIFPLNGVHIPLRSNIMIGVMFTAISLTRSYAIRRWFNKEDDD